MKLSRVIFGGLVPLCSGLLLAGCQNTGSPYQPGPVAGKAVGYGAGTVAGNAAGFGKGVVGGTVVGYQNVMDPSYRMVRYWRTEVTSDGRMIQVPYDILVDQYGRPVKMPAPTGNPKPPPSALPTAATPNVAPAPAPTDTPAN